VCVAGAPHAAQVGTSTATFIGRSSCSGRRAAPSTSPSRTSTAGFEHRRCPNPNTLRGGMGRSSTRLRVEMNVGCPDGDGVALSGHGPAGRH
jgi:hypothetical protein